MGRPPAPKAKGKGKAAAKQSAPTEAVSDSSAQEKDPVSSKQQASNSDPTRPTVIAEPAQLHLWDNQHGKFQFQGEVTAKIVHNLNVGFEFWLMADGEDGPVLGHKIESEMNHRWAVKAFSLTWNHTSESGTQRSWCLAFRNKDDYEGFQRCFTQSMWESSFKTSFLKAKVCSSFLHRR